LIPENPRDLRGDECHTLDCPPGGEIWGLHGIFGRFHIHDLGLAVRCVDKQDTPPLLSPDTSLASGSSRALNPSG
jgi:hypothetical protein